MHFKMAVRTAAKLEQFLVGREWEIDGDLTGILDRTRREIERLQQGAIWAIVGKLERYQEEATAWAANEMTDLEGKPDRISKREQQKSRTDVRHIKAAIERMEVE